MPLVGGSGAGNTAGSNPSGIGTSLNYIGDHAFAYSGGQGMLDADQTALEFNTQQGYLLGNFFFTGGAVSGNAGGGITTFTVTFNDDTIMVVKLETGQEQSPTFAKCNVIIPSYTNVKIVVYSNLEAASLLTSANFTGRVYA